MYGHAQTATRLRSRNSFMNALPLENGTAAARRLERWVDNDPGPDLRSLPLPAENLPKGTHLARKDWVTLNRARTRVGRTNDNLYRWGLAPDPSCPCGEPVQTMEHILTTCSLSPSCSDQDLLEANDAALNWIRWWSEKI